MSNFALPINGSKAWPPAKKCTTPTLFAASMYDLITPVINTKTIIGRCHRNEKLNKNVLKKKIPTKG